MDGLELQGPASAHAKAAIRLGTQGAGHVRHHTYIVLGEQMEGAEELVVFEVEGAGGFKVAAEGKHGRGFYDKFFRGAHLTELLVVLGGGNARCAPRTATVVGVVVVAVGIEVWLVVLRSVGKHGCDGLYGGLMDCVG